MSASNIEPTMHIQNLSFTQGSAKAISGGEDDEYVSNIDFVVPTDGFDFPCGLYTQKYEGASVDVLISEITEKGHDPIWVTANESMLSNIGASGSGFEMIPFEAVTDNRANYPATLVRVIFQTRIATWVDDSQESGVKVVEDYEKMQILGGVNNEEKIIVLTVMNRLIAENGWRNSKLLSYDDITNFLEAYYKKGQPEPLVVKLNALTSRSAYKSAILDYVFQKSDEQETKEAILDFNKSIDDRDILSEEELFCVVKQSIVDILKHHMDNRRWIEAFWDGKRDITHEGKGLEVPKHPKKEPEIQPTLYVVLSLALEPLGIQVVRESDEGAGWLDFRFLYTTSDKKPLSVAVEFKLAHHGDIKKGITRQLPAYLRAVKSNSGLYVVMWFKDGKYFKKPSSREKNQMESWLVDQAEITSKKEGMLVEAIMLDASIRPSASSL